MIKTIPFTGKNKQSGELAVFLYSGTLWYGGIAGEKSHQIKKVPSNAVNALPAELLEWGVAQGADRVRIVIPAEIHNLEIELPAKLSLEETHTAIMWETAAMTGKSAIGLRSASTKLSALGIQKGECQIISSTFDVKLMEGYREQCKRGGLLFDGVASLQAAVLASHRENPGKCDLPLIFLMHNALFAFLSPNKIILHPAIRNIPFDWGRHGDNPQKSSSLLKQKLSERLKLSGMTVRFIEIAGLDSTLKEAVFNGVAPEKMESVVLEDILDDLVRIISKSESESMTVSCPLTTLPKLKMDKNKVVNMLCLALVFFGLVFVFLKWGWLEISNFMMERELKQYREFMVERQTVEKRNRLIEDKIEKKEEFHNILTGQKRVADKFMNFLLFLATTIPSSIRIESIHYSDDIIYLRGVTVSQGDFSFFCNQLAARVKKDGLNILVSSLEKSKGIQRKFNLEIGTINE